MSAPPFAHRWSIAPAFAATIVLSLAGCASEPPPAPTPPRIEEYDNARGAAISAFERGRHAQAAELFDRVRRLAWQRDDAPAIIDAGYNSAVALAQISRNDAAAERLAQVRADSARAGLATPPEVDLLDATLRYRGGDLDGAEKMAQALAGTGLAAQRATFLLGTIAAARGDVSGVTSALSGLDALEDAAADRITTDADELRAHLARLRGDHTAALAGYESIATARAASGELRAMTRALSFAAESAETTGDPGRAASLWLRAGRSALARDDQPEARRALGEAARLGADTDTGRAARDLMGETITTPES